MQLLLSIQKSVFQIPAAKDVDGLTTTSAGLLARGEPGLRPCTPSGVVRLLDLAAVEIRGRDAVVVGRSELVGRPMGQLLLHRDATVTMAHSRADDLDPHTIDTVPRALGRSELVGLVAIGAKSLSRGIAITRRARGAKRIASAYPTPPTRLRAVVERRRGLSITAIWGGSPIDSGVGARTYAAFLPAALADGRYRTFPAPLVVGDGLAASPAPWPGCSEASRRRRSS